MYANGWVNWSVFHQDFSSFVQTQRPNRQFPARISYTCSQMHIRPSAALHDICDIKNKARFWSLSRECDGSKSGLIVWKQLPRCYRLRIAQVDTRRRRSGMRGAGENPQEDGRDVRIGGFWFQRWLQLCMTGFWCGETGEVLGCLIRKMTTPLTQSNSLSAQTSRMCSHQ